MDRIILRFYIKIRAFPMIFSERFSQDIFKTPPVNILAYWYSNRLVKEKGTSRLAVFGEPCATVEGIWAKYLSCSCVKITVHIVNSQTGYIKHFL